MLAVLFIVYEFSSLFFCFISYFITSDTKAVFIRFGVESLFFQFLGAALGLN